MNRKTDLTDITDLEAQSLRAREIYNLLFIEYPDVKCALNYKNPFELLIATILSAQSTDVGVNNVTKTLFKKYKKPEDYLSVPVQELEQDIYSTGFYRQKARSLRNCCSALIEKHKGKVPEDFEALNALPGVGRKTASVVMGNAFGFPSIAVDTHVKRLSNLLGLVKSEDPEEIEFKLKELVPEDRWVMLSHLLIAHGRKICIARRPKCQQCVVGGLCPSFNPKLG